MNKAVSRNIRGVDFDAQSAARDAARREGKSLGEWLHDVIADHAADLGVGQNDVAGQDRVDAVTSRLERLGERESAPLRRSGSMSQLGSGTTRPVQARSNRANLGHAIAASGSKAESPRSRPRYRDEQATEDSGHEARRVWRAAGRVGDAESLLEDAVELMERRATQTERRTEEALASFAKMMETNEARRAQEHDAVSALTEKMASLETKLTRQFASGENPVKGALARLEARLDLISKRNSAESDARANALRAERPVSGTADAVSRLEDKLNSILNAVQVRQPQASETSHLALRAAQRSEPAPVRRSLGEAIAEISQRQQTLESADWNSEIRPKVRETAPRAASVRSLFREPAAEARAPRKASLESPALARDAVGGSNGIGDLISKIDDMRRDLAANRELRRSMRGGDLDGLRNEIASMSRTLQEVMPRGAVSSLEESVQSLATRLERESSRRGMREGYAAADEMLSQQKIGNLEKEVRTIASKVDGLREAGIDRAAAELLQDQMRDLAEAAAGLRTMITTAPGARALENIELRLDLLAGKVDEARLSPAPTFLVPEPKVDTSALEGLVRELGDKIEAVQAPSADTFAIEALQHQIGRLSERFERSEQDLSTLPTLAESVRELFNQLETTRASVETSAAQAAREVLRIAADDGRGRTPAAGTREIAALKALHDNADQRTQSTLNSVHQLLEKVVDRLSSVESEVAEVRKPAAAVPSAPTPSPRIAAQRPAAPKAAKTSDQAAGFDFPFAGMDAIREPLVPTAGKRSDPAPAVDAADSAQHANFIAAARRAAKTAQAEVSIAALKRPPSTAPADKAARADLLARSRAYVSTHKRPVLMGLAAILMVIGTIALLQRTSFGGNGQQIAGDDASSRITVAASNDTQTAGRRVPTIASNELSPSALPRAATPLAAPIPGSDPIQTGSIPSLPSFAARAPASSSPRPILPSGLQVAAEAGNGDAEYELGARYSDGRGVARDLKLAAQWLTKAADQGLAPAQYRLASFYEKGLGVTQDKARAKNLYTSAAEAGNPRAMHNLAVMLADGDGRPDYAAAALWFRKAANYGVHDSQYNLAILLARGLGVQQSLVQSYQWFAVAATTNDTDAARKRDEVAAKMNAGDLAVAKALATAFQPKTANAASVEIEPPPGGWDGAPSSSHLNSAKSKISSL